MGIGDWGLGRGVWAQAGVSTVLCVVRYPPIPIYIKTITKYNFHITLY